MWGSCKLSNPRKLPDYDRPSLITVANNHHWNFPSISASHLKKNYIKVVRELKKNLPKKSIKFKLRERIKWHTMYALVLFVNVLAFVSYHYDITNQWRICWFLFFNLILLMLFSQHYASLPTLSAIKLHTRHLKINTICIGANTPNSMGKFIQTEIKGNQIFWKFVK